MRDPETYLMPTEGWICFHCGERFKTFGAAEDHFGSRPGNGLACRIVQEDMGLLMELRKAQKAAAAQAWDSEEIRKLASRLLYLPLDQDLSGD